MFRVSFTFNDSYILKFWVGYNMIFLIRITYMSVKWTASMRVSRLNSLKHFMNLPGYVQGRNEHNYKNWKMSKKELCEFYCLGIHKGLTVQKHRVHWLASIFDSLSQRKVQSHKLLLLTVTFPLLSLCLYHHLHCVYQFLFMWGIVGKIA